MTLKVKTINNKTIDTCIIIADSVDSAEKQPKRTPIDDNLANDKVKLFCLRKIMKLQFL